jgi:AcrR family transcriptional regulator
MASISRKTCFVAYATQGAKLVQNSNAKDDLRVQRTRKLLEDAMIELTIEKGFSSLTVRDITDRAMVNRSTFYRHYLDKYDLLTQYMTSLSPLTVDDEAMWTAPISEETASGTVLPLRLIKLLEHVKRYGEFYRVMLGGLGDPVFVQQFRQNTEERFRYLITYYEQDKDPKSPPMELRLSYVSCATIGAIMWWLESDQPCSIEELARWLSKMSTASVGLPPWPPEAN